MERAGAGGGGIFLRWEERCSISGPAGGAGGAGNRTSVNPPL